MVCDCEFTVDPEDPEDDWHFDRTCQSCGKQWRGLHCPHDGYQNPCPWCGVMPLSAPSSQPSINQTKSKEV